TMDPKIKCSGDSCNVMFDYHCLLGHYSEDAKTIDHAVWICPKCRGKCNCSFCKKKRGERPTGQISVFIKRFGVEAAKKALMCDEINQVVLDQAARMRDAYEGVKLEEYGYESANDNTAVNSEHGAEPAETKRYSQRQSNSNARKRIAAQIEESDDEDTVASGDDDPVPAKWEGWKKCPKDVNCIVLV
ncbi:hypothetical protein H4S07_004801, partial [Coemansia furcata]